MENVLAQHQRLVQRQTTEAQVTAKQAQDGALGAAAKVALLEARVAEATVQRGQVEQLLQSLSRSRDESLLVDIESALRVALQQSALVGSAEPLLSTLRLADARLARYGQPMAERVRRAIARDLEDLKAIDVAAVNTLTVKLDKAVLAVGELPLLTHGNLAHASATAASPPAAPTAASSVSISSRIPALLRPVADAVADIAQSVWSETKSLVRVTRIDHPEAMLIAPEQAFFLRENIKLRLLNARLALLSRHFGTVQSDLQAVQISLARYFDPSRLAFKTTLGLIQEVATQARPVALPQPEQTFAALSAAAGR